MATFDQVLPVKKYELLRDILLAHLRQPESLCLQSSHFKRALTGVVDFVLVSQPELTLLLQAMPCVPPEHCSDHYRVQLSQEPQAIAAFLVTLSTSPKSKVHGVIQQVMGQIKAQPQQPCLPGDLSLALLTAMAAPMIGEVTTPSVLACQPIVDVAVNVALMRQLEQERLLNQIVTQMRQSLELPVIFQTTLSQVREFLQVDRLLILQVDPLEAVPESPSAGSEGLPVPGHWGWVRYESLARPELPSALQVAEGYWFTLTELSDYLKTADRVVVVAKNSVRESVVAYVGASAEDNAPPLKADSPPFIARSQALLTELGGEAMLLAPIRIQKKLWGFVMAQTYAQPHSWAESEQGFLAQIAEHLAIAAQQAQLYAELQLQTLTLEQRVVERTQALQEALVATQSANRIKGDFLATISHELRTPLTCVIGMSATLLRWSLGPLNDKQRSYLKTIHDSGEHLLELINDILDLSQIEAGRAVLHLSEFSLTQLARQTLQMMRERATTAGVELRAEILMPPHREQFMGDQRRIRQMLLNLLSNAIKFTPAGGRVTLRIWLESTLAILQVEDTGIGIAEQKKPLLFQKFQQLDTTYQRSYEGLGLGLALTRHLVELHQGWIEVDSTEGKGSIFTIELPQQHAPGKRLLPPSRGTGEVSGRIVLIEDQEDTATLICELLTAAGYQVVWMVEPTTAIDQMQFLQPLATILSVNLAGMDSYEMIRTIRHHPPTQDVKILLLAQPTRPEARQPYLEVGADAYLTYPIEPQHLLHKIRTLLTEPVLPVG